MAGYSWRQNQNALTLLKRDPPCVPQWEPSGPCQGDGRSAFQPITQSNCNDQPVTSRSDCRSQMPYTCSINDVTLDPSVKTCGDCTSIPEGQACYLVCADPAAALTFFSLHSLLCLQSGWSQITEINAPKCVVVQKSCPPIISWNGMATDHNSVCVGAFPGDVCRSSCMPGYYSSNGWYDATCTSNYTWSRQLTCECQGCDEFGDPQCAFNSNDNSLNYKYI